LRSTALSFLVLLVGIIVFLFITIVLGIVIIVVGLIMLYFRRRSASRVRLDESAMPARAAPYSTPALGQESSRVACKYCGTLNDQASQSVCSKCGAPITP
jgi:uncharacterized paraquat-inducible protein A